MSIRATAFGRYLQSLVSRISPNRMRPVIFHAFGKAKNDAPQVLNDLAQLGWETLPIAILGMPHYPAAWVVDTWKPIGGCSFTGSPVALAGNSAFRFSLNATLATLELDHSRATRQRAHEFCFGMTDLSPRSNSPEFSWDGIESLPVDTAANIEETADNGYFDPTMFLDEVMVLTMMWRYKWKQMKTLKTMSWSQVKAKNGNLQRPDSGGM